MMTAEYSEPCSCEWWPRTLAPAYRVRQIRRSAPVPPRQPALRTHIDHRHHQSRLRRMAECVRRRKNDDGVARPPNPPLRYRRDQKRQLALQEPRQRSRFNNPRPRHLRNPDQLRRRKRLSLKAKNKGVPFGCRSGVPIGRRLTAYARISATTIRFAGWASRIRSGRRTYLSPLRTGSLTADSGKSFSVTAHDNSAVITASICATTTLSLLRSSKRARFCSSVSSSRNAIVGNLSRAALRSEYLAGTTWPSLGIPGTLKTPSTKTGSLVVGACELGSSLPARPGAVCMASSACCLW